MRDCEYCGKPFEARYGKRNRFCTDECCDAWHTTKPLYTFVCGHCGKTYSTHFGNRNQYCSRECAFAHKHEVKEQRIKDAEEGIGDFCPLYLYECAECGKLYLARRKTAAPICSRECFLRKNRKAFLAYVQRRDVDRRRICITCGKEFLALHGDKSRRYCSDECIRRSPIAKENCRKAHQARRARKYNNGKVESISAHVVFECDDWVCGICGERVDRALKSPDPYSASLDHIVALAAGGTHTWDNVQCAHLICNSRKRDLPMSEFVVAAGSF